jgi:hypothetical protein
MESKPSLHAVEPPDTKERDSGASLASHFRLEDMEHRLDAVRRREKRHLLWMFLGVSPAAAIPALGLFLEGSSDLLLLLFLLVSVVHCVYWNKAAREAERMEKEVFRLRTETLTESEEPLDRPALPLETGET